MTRRRLQVATAVLAIVPVLTGLIGLTGIYDPLYASAQLPHSATLDSNLRFYSGAWLGLGLAALWLLPRIERETGLYRALWGMIFLGGLGRLFSLVQVGVPFPPFLGFTVLEVVGAPVFVWWQHRLAQAENAKAMAEIISSAGANSSLSSGRGPG